MKIMSELREDKAKETFCYNKRKRPDIRYTQLHIWWVQPSLCYTEE